MTNPKSHQPSNLASTQGGKRVASRPTARRGAEALPGGETMAPRGKAGVSAESDADAPKDTDAPKVRVIERSLDILESMSEGPRTLSEIARDTTLSKGTVFRLLAGLGHRGMVVRDPVSARYMLGPGLLRLVSGAVSGLASIASLSRGVLAELAQSTAETVALHVQVGVERVCIYEVPSPQSIRYTSSVGSSAPLSTGSAGKVLLAFMDPTERDRLLPLVAPSSENLDQLRQRIEQAASQGWAVSVGERVEGASAISVPVTTELLQLSLSVLGPTSRLPDSSLIEFLPDMRRTSTAIADLVNATSTNPD